MKKLITAYVVLSKNGVIKAVRKPCSVPAGAVCIKTVFEVDDSMFQAPTTATVSVPTPAQTDASVLNWVMPTSEFRGPPAGVTIIDENASKTFADEAKKELDAKKEALRAELEKRRTENELAIAKLKNAAQAVGGVK